MLLLSLSSILVFVFLIFLGKTKLVYTSLISFLITLFLGISIWQIRPEFIGISIAKGVFIAFDILVIIFGAILFLDTLNKTKIIESLCLYLEGVSKDYRIQVILLAWLFENFLEGTAGFGTPSTVVAPLLLGTGFSPLIAVGTALLGNSASTVFGAVGTPIRTGFAELNITDVPYYSSLINIVGFLVPVFMLWLITSQQKDRRTHFWEALPFAIVSGLAFVIPSFFLTRLGQEFPSIIGSIVGFLIIFIFIKLKIFIPKTTRRIREENLVSERMPLYKVLFPYILLIFLLVAGKFVIGNKGISVNLGFKHTFNFYNPGLIFIITSIPTLLFLKNREISKKNIFVKSLKGAIEPFLTIALISSMVQLMINSNQNTSESLSFLQIITNYLKTPLLPLFTPALGAFGSFLTGSATISNIMFGNFLQNLSGEMGLNIAKILSLELVGAAAGNMISLADILPAQAVVGLKNQEKNVLKLVILPCLIYVLIAGILGVFIT
jgi:lactate permease